MTGHRRVVVGHGADGSSIVVADDRLPELVLAPRGSRLTTLWGRDDIADLPAPVNLALPDGFIPPPGGWRVALLTFPPDVTPPLGEGEGHVLADLGAQMAKGGGRGMHTTASVEIVLVLSGDLTLEIDDGVEVHLRAGDSVVQSGTRHGWRNTSTGPATVAVFIVGARHATA